jgi:uncharacterized protein (TIGR02118 family)
MHKLVILIESASGPSFDQNWPQFLHLVERIPGLLRESTSRVAQVLFGNVTYEMIHELYFESYATMQQGLASPAGQEAGRLLQSMTGGRMVLLFADHLEDDIKNIQRYQKSQSETKAQATDLETGP